MSKKLLVVGGNGFLGSAIVKQAVARRWRVVSISRSGAPFVTPAGHQPAWSASPQVQWTSGDALDPSTYERVARECDAAITTTGILLESAYKKQNGRVGSPFGALQGLLQGWQGRASGSGQYELLNRDAALAVARTFRDTRPDAADGLPPSPPAPFVYISAEDIFRPLISARYIETKREAEVGIAQLADEGNALRPVFLRPGLMYHPQTRPLSTLPAAAIDLSSWLHHKHIQSGIPLPTLSQMLSAFPGADLSALARLVSLQPLHVDTVAKAACAALEDASVRGPVGTEGIQQLAGFQSRDRTTSRSSAPWPSQRMQAMGRRAFSTSAVRRSERPQSERKQQQQQHSEPSRIPLPAVMAIAAALYGLHLLSKPVQNDALILSQQEKMRMRAKEQGVYTWGSNRYNVVAPDTPLTTFIKSPRSIPYFDGMALRDLSMEERHAVAVDANGDVLQWGLGFFDASVENVNQTEQLDDVPLARRREKEKANELTPRGSLAAEPKDPVATLKGKDIVKVATSDAKIYALSKKGKVYVFSSVQARQWPGRAASWSLNPLTLFGALREREIDHEVLQATPAAKLARGERIVDIKAGAHHLLSLSSHGRTFSTPIDHEGNMYGQLGLRRVLLGMPNVYREVLMEPQMLTEAEQPTVFHQGQVLPAWALPPGFEGSSKTMKPVTGPVNRGIFVRPKMEKEKIISVTGTPTDVTGGADTRPHADIRFCVALHEIPTLRDTKVAQIAVGSDHCAVRTTQGKVLGWGRQTHGQTGMSAQIALEAIPVPTEVVLSKSFSNANVDIICTDVTAGADNTFFTMQRREPGGAAKGLRVDVLAVGKGQWGTLGNAMWNQVTVTPARVKTVSGLLEFSEATQETHPVPIHSVAIGKPGSVAIVLDTVEKEGHQAFGRDVMVFGHNASYQLGTGKRSNLAVPQHLPPLPPLTPARGEAAAATADTIIVPLPDAEKRKEADINSGVLTHMPHKRLQLASHARSDTHAAPSADAPSKRGQRKRKVDIEETITAGAVSMAIFWRIDNL